MSLENKKVLITYGPTWVPIDKMRVISNRSTGRLGQILARDFLKAGANVTVLEGPVLTPLRLNAVCIKKYFFYDELSRLLKRELQKRFDVIIHAAAVSDYCLKKVFKAKIKSGQKEVLLKLVPTEKMIDGIKKRSPRSFLVGFKLEDTNRKDFLKRNALPLMKKFGCDLVVTNSLKNGYTAYIINSGKSMLGPARSRDVLAKMLLNCIARTL